MAGRPRAEHRLRRADRRYLEAVVRDGQLIQRVANRARALLALVARELARRGQPVQTVGAWSGTMGHAQAIRIHPDGSFLEGGADPRGDGAAVGW